MRDTATVFAALGDNIRLMLLDRLGTDGPATATELAAPLPISRQAVTRHLRVLQLAGLLHTRKRGRDVRFHVDATAITTQAQWLETQASAWSHRLADVKARAESSSSG